MTVNPLKIVARWRAKGGRLSLQDEEADVTQQRMARSTTKTISGPQPVSTQMPLLQEAQMLARLEKVTSLSPTVPQVDTNGDFPRPVWIKARKDPRGRRFPNTIAHRGYKAGFPENSMAAFRGAIAAGAQALETDMHLSKDGVVVLSHDKDLKRCFGIDKKLLDCDWDYLKTVRSTRTPGEPLASLRELLEYLASPGLEDVWVMLDIKIDNNPDELMRLIAETIGSVQPSQRPWSDRLVLGCWIPKFLPLCERYLPGFPISHIGASTLYARQFFQVPNCSFNMFSKTLLGPIGGHFLKQVKARDRELFAWTVNEPNMMKWCIHKELDGVITDNPKLFKQICDEWRDDEPLAMPTWLQYWYSFWLFLVVGFFVMLFKFKHPQTVKQYLEARPPKGDKKGQKI